MRLVLWPQKLQDSGQSFPVDAQGPSYLQQEGPLPSASNRDTSTSGNDTDLLSLVSRSHKPFLGMRVCLSAPMGLPFHTEALRGSHSHTHVQAGLCKQDSLSVL